MDHILCQYADMMNNTCIYKNDDNEWGNPLYFTSKELTAGNFPYYCAYKDFSEGEIYDTKLCKSCENHWENLNKLRENPSLLCLLNHQQKEIDKLKEELENVANDVYV
jgi:hypothetical protein